jgi:hypothetical protein
VFDQPSGIGIYLDDFLGEADAALPKAPAPLAVADEPSSSSAPAAARSMGSGTFQVENKASTASLFRNRARLIG